MRLTRGLLRIATRRRNVSVGRTQSVEQHSCRRRCVIRYDRVVDKVHLQSILEGDAAAIPAGYVVHDDVVGDRHAIPVARGKWATRNVGAVDALQAQGATVAAFRSVALEQVRVDDQARTSTVGQARRTVNVHHRIRFANRSIRRSAHDRDATTVGRDRGIAALVEDELVVGDVAVVAQPEVGKAAAITRADVAANPVVLEQVVVGTGAEADSAGRHWRGGVQFVAVSSILGDVVVVHVHVLVVTEGQRLRAGDGRIRGFRLADGDTTRQRAGVGVNAVVGDFNGMVPAVDEDTAAALGTIRDAQTVNARRVAEEVARVDEHPRAGTRVPAITVVACVAVQRSADTVRRAIRIGNQNSTLPYVTHALG